MSCQFKWTCWCSADCILRNSGCKHVDVRADEDAVQPGGTTQEARCYVLSACGLRQRRHASERTSHNQVA